MFLASGSHSIMFEIASMMIDYGLVLFVAGKLELVIYLEVGANATLVSSRVHLTYLNFKIYC